MSTTLDGGPPPPLASPYPQNPEVQTADRAPSLSRAQMRVLAALDAVANPDLVGDPPHVVLDEHGRQQYGVVYVIDGQFAAHDVEAQP